MPRARRFVPLLLALILALPLLAAAPAPPAGAAVSPASPLCAVAAPPLPAFLAAAAKPRPPICPDIAPGCCQVAIGPDGCPYCSLRDPAGCGN